MHQHNGEIVYYDGISESDNELIYPEVGPEVLKVIVQPLSDGTVSATWNLIDRTRAGESVHGVGLMRQDAQMRTWRGRPIDVGQIPPQPIDNKMVPSFLITADDNNSYKVPKRLRTQRP